MTFRSPSLSLLLLSAGLLLACGGGSDGGGESPTAPAPPGGGSVVTIEVREHVFDPRSVTIQPGQTVRWVFRGQDPTHTATARDGAFDSGFVFRNQGDTFERRFDGNGQTFEYFCRSHRDCCEMKGSIRVGSNAPAPDPGYG